MADQAQKKSSRENAVKRTGHTVEDLERKGVDNVVRMATSIPDIADQAVDGMEQTARRVRLMNEEMIQSASSSGRWMLDTYEQTLRTMLDFHLAAAESTQIQWVNAMARAQAQFMLEFSNFYTRAARNLLG